MLVHRRQQRRPRLVVEEVEEEQGQTRTQTVECRCSARRWS